ncbi:MAG TPA: hypothetical protein VGH74_14225, partial [Planctomycetaceae bacterium]
MKWFFPAIAGGLVLALGFAVTRAISSSRAAAAAEQARVNELQVAAAEGFANNDGKPAASSDAKSATAAAANQGGTAETGPAVVEGSSENAGGEKGNTTRSSDSRSDGALSVAEEESNHEPQEARSDLPGVQSDPSAKGMSGVRIFRVQHHDAASLADVLRKIWPTKADKIYVDPRK